MKLRKPVFAALAAILLVMSGCHAGVSAPPTYAPLPDNSEGLNTDPSSAQHISVTDMAGRTIDLDAPVTRVVALAPSDCEILYAIGAGDLIVGRGEYCDFPESISDIPAVGTGGNTNLEEIAALQPQAVVMAEMAQTSEQVESLEASGIQCIMSDADDIEGVYEAISLLGAVTGRDADAEALISNMKTSFSDISADASNADGKTVYFEVSPLEYGLWTAGSNTFMTELADMLGVKNAFSDVDGWAAISEEQVIERDPDYIVTITMYYGEGPTPTEEIMGRSGWQELKAVKNGHVFNADSNEISRPGPRLVLAAETIKEFFAE